jgi:hypothetical protein
VYFLGEAIKPFAAAETRKAELEHDAVIKLSEHDLTKFRVAAVASVVGGLGVLAVAVVLIVTGNVAYGVLIVSHAVALVIGVVGGRGMHKEGGTEG